MTEAEEHKSLEDMWLKIRTWILRQPHFSRTKEFRFPHNPYHWTKLEVYPDGDCAMLSGSWGNPGEYMPTLLHGDELFEFNGYSSGMSWYGDIEDLERARSGARKHTAVDYHADFRDTFDGYTGYRLLRKLYDNWNYIKGLIVAEVNADDGLKNFEV